MVILVSQRMLWFVPVLLGVTLVSFALLYVIPGDPILNFVGDRSSPEVIEELRNAWGLERPLVQQYAVFLGNLFRGRLGESFRTRLEVGPMLLERMGNTLTLALAAVLVSSFVGISLGVAAAIFNGPVRQVILSLSVLSLCVPVYLWALFILWLFAIRFAILPVGGNDSWKHVILPALSLSMRLSAYISRITYQELQEVLGADYIRTAIGKGIPYSRVVFKHGLRNALIPVVTIIGLDFASLLNGSVLTETIFAWPGIGRAAVEALLQRDLPVIQGVVLLSAVIYLIVNLVLDIIYVFIDPRVRYG